MIFFSWLLKDFSEELLTSKLFDENTFYEKFIKDLRRCTEEVIIESPYITCKRMDLLEPIFEKLVNSGVKVYIITRDPIEHEENLARQAELGISIFEEMGIQVLICAGNHHRKLAILDRKILWEGSLNILSQMHSREIMRRIESEKLTRQMFNFLKLDKLDRENAFVKRMFL